jgi:hypothetical protein
VEQRLLCFADVKITGLVLAAVLFICFICLLPAAVNAQENSRLAAGVDFVIAAADHAAAQDHAHSQFFPEPVFRFGRTDPGWGVRIGLNWYAVDIDRTVGGAATPLGELHIRPVMAGYGYTWARGKNAVTAALLGGYAFGSMELADDAPAAYQSRLGVRVTDADASNTFVLRPEVDIWHDINKLFGLNVNIGYIVARPDVTVATSVGADRRTARADQFQIRVGLVYSIF